MKFLKIEIKPKEKTMKSNYFLALILISMIITFVSGCITLGKDFPEANVPSITIGETTRTLLGHMAAIIIHFLVREKQRI